MARGALTDQDKEYLDGNRELSEGSEYNTRRRIVKRLTQSIDDIAYYRELTENDKEKAIDPLSQSDANTLRYLANEIDGGLIEIRFCPSCGDKLND